MTITNEGQCTGSGGGEGVAHVPMGRSLVEPVGLRGRGLVEPVGLRGRSLVEPVGLWRWRLVESILLRGGRLVEPVVLRRLGVVAWRGGGEAVHPPGGWVAKRRPAGLCRGRARR